MKERPILFSGPMVRAILEGRKTQTRRLVRLVPDKSELNGWRHATRVDWHERYGWAAYSAGCSRVSEWFASPHGMPGDRLWVRETFTHITGNGIRVHYRADGEPTDSEGRALPTEPGLPRWRPSIFMRRRESRITLELTEVRVQRLQEISDDDARAEGVDIRKPAPAKVNGEPGVVQFFNHRDAFAYLWNVINGKRSPWASNPWVWALTFRRAS